MSIKTLPEAIADLVHDGDTVALEGFTHLIPVAAGQEIIRQGRRQLTLVRMTPDIVYDQMIGAGCARKLIFSWGGNPGVEVDAVRAATGWVLAVAHDLTVTEPTTADELEVLRRLEATR